MLDILSLYHTCIVCILIQYAGHTLTSPYLYCLYPDAACTLTLSYLNRLSVIHAIDTLTPFYLYCLYPETARHSLTPTCIVCILKQHAGHNLCRPKHVSCFSGFDILNLLVGLFVKQKKE